MGYALKMPEMQKNRPQIFRFEVCMWCARRDGVRMTECDLPPRRRRGFVGFGHSSFSPGKPPLPRGPHYPASSRVAPDIKNGNPDGVAVLLVREAGLEPARPE